MRRGVVIVLALLGLAAPAAASAVEWPVTNGRDVAVWSKDHVLHVSYDDGMSRTFPVPGPGCDLGGVNSTAAGLLCGPGLSAAHTLDLVDLQSGEVSHPAAEALIEQTTSPTADGAGFTLQALGDHVARVDMSGLKNNGTFWLGLDQGGVALDLGRPPPVGSVVDLDAPTGLTPVCDPAPTRATRPLLYRAPWILTQHGARVQLRHCGSTVTRTIGRSPWRRPVLTGRFAAWRSDAAHVTIRVLATGRTYRIAAPHLRTMVATDHRLWLQATYSPLRYRVQVFRVR